jgi:hypothetical protein
MHADTKGETEYWITVEDLEQLHKNIVGKIEIIEKYPFKDFY